MENKNETLLLQDEILSKLYSVLLEWRKKYSREEYSSKVVRNMFYDLYTLQASWPFILNSFTLQGKEDFKLGIKYDSSGFSDYNIAFNWLVEIKRKIQVEKILPDLDALLLENIPIRSTTNKYNTDIRFSNYSKMIESAISGSDSDLEKIERYYIWYEMLSELIYSWAAAGLLGKNPWDACMFVTDMQPGANFGGNFEDSDDVFEVFNTITSMYLSGTNANTGENFGKYKTLPSFIEYANK
ncbi:MAG: hypothetical protein WDK96_01445 [Candidatus Paceibacterota bacterium]|jgi:hypothetical protein